MPGSAAARRSGFCCLARLVAQSYTGPKGHKEVVRQSERGTQGRGARLAQWRETIDTNRLAAASLVADGYGLFLLGPMLLASNLGVGRALVMELAPSEQITVFQQTYDCNVLRVRLQPGSDCRQKTI